MPRLFPVCLVVVLLWMSSVRADGWSWQNPRPQGNDLLAVQFLDARHGWALGDMGTVMRTADGGLSWSVHTTGSNDYLNSVCFLDTLHGWITDTYGSVYSSGDGGQSWTLERRMPMDYYGTIRMRSISDGWICGGRGNGQRQALLLHSTDGGHEWQEVPLSDTLHALQDLVIVSDTLAWMLGSSGPLLKSTDGGATWQTQPVPGLTSYARLYAFDHQLWILRWNDWVLHSADDGASWDSLRPAGDMSDFSPEQIVFVSPTCGWITGAMQYPGYGAYSCRTTDGGQSWDVQPFNGGALALTAVPGGDEAWMVGTEGCLYRVTERGNIWQSLDQRIDGDFRRVRFADESHGWIVGGDNYSSANLVLHTTDGGQSWLEQELGGWPMARDLAVWNADTAWIAAGHGSVFRTNDGGEHWSEQPTGSGESFLGICFVDPLRGWAVGGNNTVMHTTDGGTTWQEQFTVPASGYLWSVAFLDRWRGCAANSSGDILRTSDGGASWDTVRVHEDFSDGFEELLFSDALNGWAAGESGLYHSTDAGETWAVVDVGTNWNSFTGLAFADPLHGWVVGHDMAHTTDGGQTWIVDEMPCSGNLTDVDFVAPNMGWAINGVYGAPRILHYGADPVAIDAPRAARVASFALQAFPNPFNPATELRFSLPTAARVKLGVYDLLGREVTTLADAAFTAGTHRVRFDGAARSSGIYFARLEAHGVVATSKLILLK